MTRFSFFICLISMFSMNASAAKPILSATEYGDIRFGAKLSEAEKKLSQRAKVIFGDSGCSFVSFPKFPHITFMVEKGIVTRADAEAGLTNTTGIGIGDSMGRVKKLFPKAQISEHKYDAQGHYITFPTADGRAALVMEESAGKITVIRGGINPSVNYVEGCL